MNTEEKINELLNECPINKAFLTEDELSTYHQGLRCGAYNMAEWKEQQMIDWVRKNAYRYIDTDNDSEGHLCERFLEDAFIDDFKKAIKD